MASPFPGMNPYLENPAFWSEFHNLLISLTSQKLNPLLRPKYRVAIEQRVYQTSDGDTLLVGVPNVAVQSYQTNKQVLKTHGEYEQQAWEALTPLERRRVISITPPEVIKLSQAKKAGKISEFRELRENVYQVRHNGCLFWEIVYKSKVDALILQL